MIFNQNKNKEEKSSTAEKRNSRCGLDRKCFRQKCFSYATPEEFTQKKAQPDHLTSVSQYNQYIQLSQTSLFWKNLMDCTSTNGKLPSSISARAALGMNLSVHKSWSVFQNWLTLRKPAPAPAPP